MGSSVPEANIHAGRGRPPAPRSAALLLQRALSVRNRWDSLKAIQVIARMRNDLKCDFIIASCQFREWDFPYPHEPQKKICNILLKAGADMVYGSSAHQAQEMAFFNHKPVIYGMGNLLFDQIHRIAVRQAYFLQMYFYRGKLIQVQPVLTFMTNNRQQHIASPAESAEIRKVIFNDALIYKKQ